MTILITGGTGFLGSYFASYAVDQGESVILLDRYIDRGRIADVLDRVTLIEGDIADPGLLARLIADHGVDRIAHYAFLLGSPKPDHMLPYVQVQCLGTANVFEAARIAGVKRVLYASSVGAYGKQQVDLLTEDLVPNPADPYATCKRWGELTGKHYREQLGLDVVTLRFGSTYGSGRSRRGSYASGMLTPQTNIHYMARVEEAARGLSIEMPRDDSMADWTYAGDAAQAAWLALNARTLENDLYNVQADRRPVGDFTAAIRKVLPQIEVVSSKTETPGHAHPPMSNARIVRDLGFFPKYSFEEGVRDYIRRINLYDLHHANQN